jgi:hypothetical protein
MGSNTTSLPKIQKTVYMKRRRISEMDSVHCNVSVTTTNPGELSPPQLPYIPGGSKYGYMTIKEMVNMGSSAGLTKVCINFVEHNEVVVVIIIIIILLMV